MSRWSLEGRKPLRHTRSYSGSQQKIFAFDRFIQSAQHSLLRNISYDRVEAAAFCETRRSLRSLHGMAFRGKTVIRCSGPERTGVLGEPRATGGRCETIREAHARAAEIWGPPAHAFREVQHQ